MTEARSTGTPPPIPEKPSAPHPAALALFKSLDLDLADRQKSKPSKTSIQKEERHITRCSDDLRKRVQTAGWRNRHSQSDLYPVNMRISRIPVIKDGYVAPDCSTNQQSENDATDITFHVRQVQCGELEETYGTGATVWPASLVLLKYMEKIGNTTGFFESKTVSDLGSGTGLTSVAAALLGASLVVCSDGCELVVELACDNINNACKELQQTLEKKRIVNSRSKIKHKQQHYDRQTSYETATFWIQESEIRAKKYRWGDGSMIGEINDCRDVNDEPLCSKQNCTEGRMKDSDPEAKRNFFDVILVSDCVLPKLYPIGPLVDAIDELSGPNTLSLLSYEHRYYPEFDPKEEFSRLAKERNLVVRTVPQEELDPIYSADDIEIWEVRRK